MSGKSDSKPVAVNRKAHFEYSVEEEFEAGLVLMGTEVKSLREGKANIADAYAAEKGGELWLLNAQITEYAQGNRFNHEVRRPRKLLLHKRQMNKLIGRLKVRGVTLVPIRVFFNARGYAKIILGLATGKKQHDKREAKKAQEWKREQSRLLKNR